MSNKTRLQTNNTNLQALIDKANALPDAGGSGGGATVEICNGEIIVDAPNMTDFTVYAVNENLQVSIITLDAMTGGTFGVAKGTVIAIKPWSSMVTFNGNCSQCFANSSGGAYTVTGDFSLTFAG